MKALLRTLLLAIAVASVLTACAPRKPIVGAESCAVWTDAQKNVISRGVSNEYAAGFVDAHGVTTPTRDLKYGWVIDTVTEECKANPSETIGDAFLAALKQFEK